MYRIRIPLLVAVLLTAFMLFIPKAEASIIRKTPSVQPEPFDFQPHSTEVSSTPNFGAPSTEDNVAGCVSSSPVVGHGKKITLDSPSHPNPWAGVIWVRIPEASADLTPTFCTDLVTDISGGACFQTDNTNPITACPITWLLNNDYGPDNSKSNEENAARQAAVWHFADGVNVLASDSVYARTQEIISAVPNPCVLPTEPPVMTIDPPSAVNFLPGGELHTLTVTVTQAGSPVASRDVDLSADFGTLSTNMVTTDASGQATFTINSTATGTAHVVASFPYQLPSGTRFTKLDGAADQQVLVLGTPQDGEVSATATKTWEEGTLIVAHKFNDMNTNGVQDSGEESLSDWEMTLQISDGQGGWTDVASGFTNQDGNVVFNGLPEGTYRVVETQQAGWTSTTPNPSDPVVLVAGDQAVIEFGNVSLAVIKAYKFHDLNGNGVREDNEPLLDGWMINIDPAGNGIGSDQTTSGSVSFIDLHPGTYTVWETQQPGWCATTGESMEVTIGANEFAEVWFGNQACPLDWGDAPDSYGTTDANNGPNHIIIPDLHLGAEEDSETDGQPSVGANGDDNNGTPDDEDGVSFGADGPMAGICTTQNPLDVTVFNNTGENAYVYAWMDFNGNGIFDAATETLANGSTVASAATPSVLHLTYDIPCDAVPGSSYVRVRLDTAVSGIAPTGTGNEGEIEDHPFILKGWDFGDAPDYTSNQTSYTPASNNLAASGGPARHLLVDGLVLGGCVDMETNGHPSPGIPTTGDDGDDTPDSPFTSCTTADDEDGFSGTSDSNWSDGSGSIVVNVSGVSGNACVYAWIDWDRDGYATGDGNAANGGNSSTSVPVTADGSIIMTFNSEIPASNSFPDGQAIPVRLRVVPGACGTLSSTGAATGGEVEDHMLTFASPTAISLQSANAGSLMIIQSWLVASGLILLIGLTVYSLNKRYSL